MAAVQLFLEAAGPLELALVPPLEWALPQPLSQLGSRPQVVLAGSRICSPSPLQDDLALAEL